MHREPGPLARTILRQEPAVPSARKLASWLAVHPPPRWPARDSMLSGEQKMIDDDFIWKVRVFVYEWFAENAGAPTTDDIACHFGITHEKAGQALSSLHEKHALFLEPGTVTIRLANPFSGIPTAFTVAVRRKTYWANCAWDCFGIVAALQASEASIASTCAQSGAALHLTVAQDQVKSAGEIVHFLVPFRHWYDNLVYT